MALSVGYIGVGQIGWPIAENVLKAGFQLTIYDVDERPLRALEQGGAKVARSPRELAARADVVELSVVNDAQVEQVLVGPEGVQESIRRGSVIAIHSTIHPRTALRMGEIFEPKGVGVLDAPFSGGVEGALARTMCYMVGGLQQDLDHCRPVFETSAASIVHLGPLGAGATMRVIHHVVLALNRLAADEGMRLAQALGIDLTEAQRAFHGGEAQSNVTDRYLEKYRAMPVGGQYRAIEIARELAFEHGVQLPAAALFQQLYLPTRWHPPESP